MFPAGKKYRHIEYMKVVFNRILNHNKIFYNKKEKQMSYHHYIKIQNNRVQPRLKITDELTFL